MNRQEKRNDYGRLLAIKCTCGKSCELSSGWSNDCHCGRMYNGSGQELAPVEQWGEETGEDYMDLQRLS